MSLRNYIAITKNRTMPQYLFQVLPGEDTNVPSLPLPQKTQSTEKEVKKKQKFVSLYSKEGQAKSIVQLAGMGMQLYCYFSANWFIFGAIFVKCVNQLKSEGRYRVEVSAFSSNACRTFCGIKIDGEVSVFISVQLFNFTPFSGHILQHPL